MKRISLLWFAATIILTVTRAFAWVDGEVLVWIGGDKGWQGLAELGKKCEAELGIPVKVEPLDGLTDKFQTAAQGGKGPDIVVWAHDRLGEWADAGLLQPLEISEEFKAGFLPLTWKAVTHNKQIWGYPLALEAISLIYNKQLVSGTSADAALGNESLCEGTPGEASESESDHVGVYEPIFQLAISGE